MSTPKIVEVMPNEKSDQVGTLKGEHVSLLPPATGNEDMDEIAMPGDKPGEKGLTRRELEQLIKSRRQLDNLDEIAPGEKEMTWREVEKLIQSQNQGDYLDQQADITMDQPGAVGMTWRELEDHIKKLAPSDPLDMESGFTETPGGKSLTFRELERLVEMRAKTAPRETTQEP